MAKPWTREELADAFRLWAEGYPAREIGKRIGRDRRVVETALARGRDWQPTYRVAGWPGKPRKPAERK